MNSKIKPKTKSILIITAISLAILLISLTVGFSLGDNTDLEDFSFLIKNDIDVMYSEAGSFKSNSLKIYLAALDNREFTVRGKYLLIRYDDPYNHETINKISDVSCDIRDGELNITYDIAKTSKASVSNLKAVLVNSVYMIIKLKDDIDSVTVNGISISKFGGGIVGLKDRVYGVVDEDMRTIVPFEYSRIKNAEFNRSDKAYYFAYRAGFCALLDEDFNILISTARRYTAFYYVNEDRFAVEYIKNINDHTNECYISLIDSNGNLLVDEVPGKLYSNGNIPFDNANGEAMFSYECRIGVIDSDLNIIYEAQFFDMSPVMGFSPDTGTDDYIMWYETFDNEGNYSGSVVNGRDLSLCLKGE